MIRCRKCRLAQCTCGEEDWEEGGDDYQTGGEAKAENELLRGQIAALRQQRDGLLKALENCRLLAARHRKEEWATHILRFCGESGVIGSPIRDNVIASIKEKS